MHLRDIIDALINSYKYVDLRLVLVRKSPDYSKIAFLKFFFDNEQIPLKQTNFFNGVCSNLVFIQKVLDVSRAHDIIDNLIKGTVELEGRSYDISSEEASYFNQEFEVPQLYNKYASSLYARQPQTYPLLLARPSGESCGSIIKSEGIQDSIKGFETIRLIESFLDSSGINLSNSRIVILLPIYCILKDILVNLELTVHRNLVDDFSLHILNSNPKIYPFKDFIKTDDEEFINTHIEPDFIKGGSQVSIYSDSLDLELDKKEITSIPPTEIILPDYVQYDSEENLLLLIERLEDQYLEFKPFLSFDYTRNREVKSKEFDTMRAIDSFLNSEGGILIVGVADDKTIIGLKGDYSILPGDRKNFDGFENKVRNLIRTKYFRNSLVGELITLKRKQLYSNDICVMEIRKSDVPIFVYNDENRQQFFIRQGNSVNKLEGIELSHYIKRHVWTSEEEIHLNHAEITNQEPNDEWQLF
jgi:hypothetical protein